jgi:hypothetical protein
MGDCRPDGGPHPRSKAGARSAPRATHGGWVVRKSTWILLGALALVAYVAVFQTAALRGLMYQVGIGTRSPAQWTIQEAGRAPDASRTPRAVRASFADRLRVPPDKRFLLAVQELHRLGGATDGAPVRLTPGDGVWSVQAGGHVATIPDLPTFEQGLALARSHARVVADGLKLRPFTGAPDLGLGRFDPSDALIRLHEIDAAWSDGERTPALVVKAARALVRLAYAHRDQMETGDRVFGKALAALALAQELGAPMTLEESLLACRMGYGTHARNVAANLPEGHPWRLFLTRDDGPLFHAALASPPGSGERYLRFVRLADKNARRQWLASALDEFTGRPVPINVVATGYRLRGFESTLLTTPFMPYLILGTLLSDNDPHVVRAVLFQRGTKGLSQPAVLHYVNGVQQAAGGDPDLLLDRFEALLDGFAERRDGAFLDQATYRGYFRAEFFSALDNAARFLLDARGSMDEAQALATALEKGDGPTAQAFHAWYQHLVSADKGQANAQSLLGDLKGLEDFGVPPLLRTLGEQLDLYPYGSPAVKQTVALLLPRMDSRLSNRLDLAHLARWQLLDFTGSEVLYRSIVRDDPDQSYLTRAYLAYFNGDTEGVLKVAGDRSLPAADRALALSEVEFPEKHADAMRAAFDALVAEEPASWDIRREYVKTLDAIGDPQGAMKVIDGWRPYVTEDTDYFDRAGANLWISKLYQRMGEPEKALAAVGPDTEGYYGPAMGQAVDLLLALGRNDDALRVAVAEADRYPQNLEDVLSLVRVLWHTGKVEAAAQVLKKWPGVIDDVAWGFHIGAAFADEFADRTEAGQAAFQALLAQGFPPHHLVELTDAVVRRDRPELAFKLIASVQAPGGQGIEIALGAYRELEKWQGHEAAVAWIKDRIPRPALGLASLLFYQEKTDDLLWELVRNPAWLDFPEAVWLMRAAAHVRSGDTDPERTRALTRYYRKAGDNKYDVMGKYLMGMVDESALADVPLGTKETTEVAYYLGLKAQADGRYADAAEWYRVSVDPGAESNGEYRWAYNTLWSWRNLDHSLEELGRRGKLG